MKKFLVLASFGALILVGSFFSKGQEVEAQNKPSKIATNAVYYLSDKQAHEVTGKYCSVTFWYTGSDCVEVGGNNWAPDAGVTGVPIGNCADRVGLVAGLKVSDGAVWYRGRSATPDAGQILHAILQSECQ